MKWFMDLSIKSKLLLSFVIVVVITLIVGYTGYSGMNGVMENQDAIYNDALIPIQDLGYANASLLISRGDVVAMISTNETQRRINYSESIKNETKKVDDLIEKFEKNNLRKEIAGTFDKFSSEWKEYKNQRDVAVNYLLEGKDEEAKQIIYGESLTHQLEARKNLRALIDNDAKFASDLAVKSDESASSSITFLIALIIAASVLAFGLGIFIARIISRPVIELKEAANLLALGDVDQNVVAKSKDEIGDLTIAFGEMINNIKTQALAAEKISEGDLSFEIKEKSNKDVLALSMKKVSVTLKDLVNEASILTKAATEGKLSTRETLISLKADTRKLSRE